MSAELKPCPFCGAQPEKVYKSSGQTTHIECPNCHAQFPKSTMENRYDEEWNTRAERTCHDDNIGGSFVCSECGASVKDTYVGRSYVDKFGKRWYATSNGQAFNYCPNCGAKVVDE